jgi:Zn-dependent protease
LHSFTSEGKCISGKAALLALFLGVLKMKCDKCAKETFLPFTCPYCKGSFCIEHRLPENHECSRIELSRLPKEELQPFVAGTQKSFDFKVTYSPLSNVGRRFHVGNKEVLHLVVATVLVVGVGLSLALGYSRFDYFSLGLFVLIFAASFFIHEFAHKIVAQRNGFWAEFRLTTIGAVLTLISVISPLKFISPGAVMISGIADRNSMGKIAIVGPLTNIGLSLGFLAGVLFAPVFPQVWIFAMTFNAFISLFNLIPFGIFDGLKVFSWDKRAWCIVFIASLTLTLYSYYRLFSGNFL